MLRTETKARARALQILYAWELSPDQPLRDTVTRVAYLTGPDPLVMDQAEALAASVVGEVAELDRLATEASDNWRLERIAAVERNILRLGIYELLRGETPPKVVITEAVQLAHWFGGAKSPGFVNGVLDRVARSVGRL